MKTIAKKFTVATLPFVPGDVDIDSMDRRTKTAYAFACAARTYGYFEQWKGESESGGCVVDAFFAIQRSIRNTEAVTSGYGDKLLWFMYEIRPVTENNLTVSLTVQALRHIVLDYFDDRRLATEAALASATAVAQDSGASINSLKYKTTIESEQDAQRTLRVWIGSDLDLPRTEQTVDFARTIVSTEDWSLAGLLADALLDAGVGPEHWLIASLQDDNVKHMPILGCNWLEQLAA